MNLLADGHRLMIEIEERMNSTSGLGSITLGMFHPDPGYTTPLVTWGVALGTETYAGAVPRMFAWADIRADEEPYEDVDRQSYHAQRSEDRTDDRFDWDDFAAWRARRPDSDTLRPFLHTPNGLAYWQLELRLNALGKAFLLVDDFAQRGRRLLTLPENL